MQKIVNIVFLFLLFPPYDKGVLVLRNEKGASCFKKLSVKLSFLELALFSKVNRQNYYVMGLKSPLYRYFNIHATIAIWHSELERWSWVQREKRRANDSKRWRMWHFVCWWNQLVPNRIRFFLKWDVFFMLFLHSLYKKTSYYLCNLMLLILTCLNIAVVP